MPKGVENLVSGSPTVNQSSRRFSVRSENGDKFQKVLEGSRPCAERADKPEKQDTPDKAPGEKQSTRPKRADAANRRRRANDQQPTDVEQIDPAAAQPDASVEVPAAPESASAEITETEPADPEVVEDAKPQKDITTPNDAAAAAILASHQIDPQQPAPPPTPQATEQDTTDTTEATDQTAEAIAATKPIVKPLVAKQATEEVAPTAKTEKHSSPELPVEVAAESSEADDDDDHPCGDQPQEDAAAIDSHDEITTKQAPTPVSSQNDPRPRKVAGLGANEPAPATKHDDQTDVDSSQQAVAAASATVEALSQLSDPQAVDPSSDDAPHRSSPVSSGTDTLNPTIASTTTPKSSGPDAKPVAAPQPPPVPPEVEFGATNHDRIVTSLRSQLLPSGGTMHMRLDPPELGVLQVTVRMQDGVMTASFETSSDQATKLLSHSLGQLKTVLESQGVTVEKLHVQQSPRDQQANSNSDDRQQQSQHDSQSSARQEQQRREMLRRMWSRLGIGNDPLDMVA